MNGYINLFLSVLGCKEGDSKILDAIVNLGANFDVGSFRFDDVEQKYYCLYSLGVSFTFDRIDGAYILSSIFFYIIGDDDYCPYVALYRLIDGINNESKKYDCIKLMGDPFDRGANWIKYKIAGKFLHIEFNEHNKISLISIFC